MPLAKQVGDKVSEEEYLKSELTSEVRHEYIDGYVYAMAGASINHNRISRNISNLLENDFIKKDSPCESFLSDMKAKESEETTKYFYPDVLVTCDPDDNESEYYVNTSIIIVEVLSESTRKYDLTAKKLYYFNIPTLQEYVVIEQDLCQIIVFRKSNHWEATYYFLGDDISFESIDVTISVENIYRRVDNKEMVDFLKDKKGAE